MFYLNPSICSDDGYTVCTEKHLDALTSLLEQVNGRPKSCYNTYDISEN